MIYDVVVIGAGPAGMMAAGVAGSQGANVLLLEKNKRLGSKILITGKGRCNVTQANFNIRDLVKAYGQNGSFLFSSLYKFGPQEVIDFFEDLDVKMKTERGGRVFPESDEAGDIIEALKKFMKKNNVEIKYRSEVTGFEKDNLEITAVKLQDGSKIKAKNFIIATGGLSYPNTGCTGEGFKWAKDFGHTVVKTAPALVPLKTKEKWIKDLMGLTLKNVGLTAWQGDKKIGERQGDMLFTHFGVSGPIVLDISKSVIDAEKNGQVRLTINLKPALSREQLDKRIQRDFKKYNNKLFRNALSDLIPKGLIPIIIRDSKINPEKAVNLITREERLRLVDLVQSIDLTVAGNMGYDLAIVTSGGVLLKEIDPKTLKSKIINNLYFIGEVLDIDAPTGGYNLTAAWSTGFSAGEAVI
jgi:predicted Rossmann fold flavoprotein